MTSIQERLFNPGEMAISMREFVRAKLEGFAMRQAARAEKRKQQREKRRTEPAGETQTYFGSEMTPEEHKAQMISFALHRSRGGLLKKAGKPKWKPRQT